MLKVGSDPELFLGAAGVLRDPATITCGHKDLPEDVGDGIAFHVDNVCLEYTHVPVSTKEEWLAVHRLAREKLSERLTGGLEAMYTPLTSITREQLANFGQEAELFRCHPDEGVWSKPVLADLGLTRVSGGHIHLGWEEDLMVLPPIQDEAVRLCDYLIGLWGVLHESPLAATRRVYYGQAGAFRRCSYGVEYRVPSNFWLTSPELTGEIFDRAILVMTLLQDPSKVWEILGAVPKEPVIEAINTCNKDLAREYLPQIEAVAA